jgi:HlyD family secretion protein
MFKQRATTADALDRNRSEVKTAEANLAAARARVAEAKSKTAAAQSDAVGLGSRVSDAELKAPVTGPVLHRIVEPGAMLAVGGKVLTLLDLSDMWMNVYFSTDKAGKISVGDEARIVLDALPDQQIPARVTFVSPKNQFTPREVETRNEREKLMFRVKVRVEQSWLANW